MINALLEARTKAIDTGYLTAKDAVAAMDALWDHWLDCRRELDAKLVAELNRLLSIPPEGVKELPVRGWYVYLLLDADYEPLYVGQSGNVLGRLGNHLTGAFRDQINHVVLYECPDEDAMSALEAHLINRLDPPRNVVKHDGRVREMYG